MPNSEAVYSDSVVNSEKQIEVVMTDRDAVKIELPDYLRKLQISELDMYVKNEQ
jgi:hypothetical protein